MTNFKLMITPEGKHPASKWADIAADEIIDISAEAPELKVKEAKEFRAKLHHMLTRHHQHMMDHEQDLIKGGDHHLDLPYDTEEHADKAVDEICKLAKGTSFEAHFAQPNVRAHLTEVCNRSFKSAKLVERHHFHSERERSKTAHGKKK
jgi:hypothetical protein